MVAGHRVSGCHVSRDRIRAGRPAATPDVRAPDGAAKSADDRAKPASEPKLRARSNDATPREEDIESDE
jgi:hypothetical protein